MTKHFFRFALFKDWSLLVFSFVFGQANVDRRDLYKNELMLERRSPLSK